MFGLNTTLLWMLVHGFVCGVNIPQNILSLSASICVVMGNVYLLNEGGQGGLKHV